MRYGICTGIENAGLVKKLGYDYIELSVTKTMGLDPAAYAAGKKALEESGIEAECFNILFPKTMNFVDGKTTSLDELEIYLEKAMAMIADLHGKVVVFGSGKCRTCPPEVKYLDAYENLVKACRLTGEIAGRYGIRVVIEPLSRKETNMVCTVTEGALLQKDVANENVGLLADYFHICANHDDVNSIASREPDKAVAVMIVDLEDLFKASDWLNNDTLCINDRNNGVLVANHELPEATENAVTELIKSSGSRKFDEAAHRTSKEEYISIISSTYENWDIAVILKEQAFASKIIDIQKLLAVVVIIYLLLTVAVIANSAAKRYLKLRNIVQVLHRGNAADPEENLTDAFAYIDSRVQKLVQDNVESSDLIEQQRTVMLREQFHAMITNADAANEADTDQLENLGFPIHRAKQYYLLAYRLQEQDLANEKDPDKIYEMQWFILQNVTRENLTSRSLENLCFREGGMQLYFIWTEKDDPEMLESILWSYEYCRSFLTQHFEFRYDIAVSSGHTGLDGVYKAYREVCRVYQYQQRTQDTGTIFYSDLKVQPGDTTVRYPVETENKLHLAVRSGNEGEACTQIQALMRQNQENYLSPAGMQFLVGKIMSTIVRAGEQRSDDPELAENQNRVMEAARRGSTEAMEQALCRLAGTVCQAVRASEQEASADEKGRLYLEIRDYIEANYSDAALNVNALSEHFDRPAPFVSRYFKEMNGTNLTQYIHKVRLEHVKEKLLQDEKLETIAITCGFGSLRSFLRIFKQYEGVTPTQYRELHGKKEETTNENI